MKKCIYFAGTYVSGPLFSWSGYYSVFITSLIFAALGITYMIFLVNESNPRIKVLDKKKTDLNEADKTVYGTEEIDHTVQEIVPENRYCTWADVVACFRTIFKKRPQGRTLLIWLLLFNFGCYIFAYNGTEGTHR